MSLKLKEKAQFLLFMDKEPNKYNFELCKFLDNNINKLNNKGIFIYCQCFDRTKLKDNEKKELKRQGIVQLPALYDKGTDDVFLGSNDIILFLSKLIDKSNNKKKKKKQNNTLLDPNEEDIEEYQTRLIEGMKNDDTDLNDQIKRETQQKEAAISQQRKMVNKNDPRKNNRVQFGNDDEQHEIETKKGDIKINNPNNRPSAKDPMFDDDDEIHIDKPKKPEFKSNKQMGKNSQDDSMEDLLMSQLGLNDD